MYKLKAVLLHFVATWLVTVTSLTSLYYESIYSGFMGCHPKKRLWKNNENDALFAVKAKMT